MGSHWYLPSSTRDHIEHVDCTCSSAAEVEFWLRLYPKITDAMVSVREVRGEKQFVVYATYDECAPTGEQLCAYLSAKLPAYPVPGAFVFLEEWPLGFSYGIDRHVLPERDGSTEALILDEVPSGEIEPVVARLWMDVLHIERVSRHDNFFDLGGDTRLAFEMSACLQEHFRIDMDFVNVPRRSSLALLAQAIASELILQRDCSDVARRAHDEAQYADAELERMLEEEEAYGR